MFIITLKQKSKPT